MKKINELLLTSIFFIFFLYASSEILAFTLLTIRRESSTQAVPDYAGGVSYKPNRLIELKGYPGNLFTDNYGFIHNGDPNRKINDDGKNNIIFIGGSTAEGANTTSNNENTISANLEKILRNIKDLSDKATLIMSSIETHEARNNTSKERRIKRNNNGNKVDELQTTAPPPPPPKNEI